MLAVISSLGVVQTISINNGDGTSRDAKYLEVMLIDSSLKESEVSTPLLNFNSKYTTVSIKQSISGPSYFLEFHGDGSQKVPSWYSYEFERSSRYKSGRPSHTKS